MKYLLFLAFALIVLQTTHAQDIKSSLKSEFNQSSYFKSSLSYLSNSVYNGRQDSVITPYITPMIGYFDKSGFYIDASLSYLANAQSRIDLTTIDVGYNFIAGDNFSGGVYASKYFYNKNSTSVKSQMKGNIGANATYDASFLSFSAGADLVLSQETDFIVNYGISHPFYLGESDDLWTIEPSITANSGTQKFYQAQKTTRRGVASGVKVNGSTSFVILDYELSAPVSYDAKKWGLSFTPTYALPQNPVSITQPNGNVFVQEKLSNVFYAELSVYIKF